MAKEISKTNKFMLTLAVAALVPGSAIAAGEYGHQHHRSLCKNPRFDRGKD